MSRLFNFPNLTNGFITVLDNLYEFYKRLKPLL